ncbi:MAG: hypothetical protein R3C53_03065 [Pirellulaceae bacterium]
MVAKPHGVGISGNIGHTAPGQFLAIFFYTTTMTAIPWNEFSKEELVEILVELEKCSYILQELWLEDDVHYVNDCLCEPSERVLPARVIELRDRAAMRIEKRGRRQSSPLRRLLRSPFSRKLA